MSKKIDHFEILSRPEVRKNSKSKISFTNKVKKIKGVFNTGPLSSVDKARKTELKVIKKELHLLVENLKSDKYNKTESMLTKRRNELLLANQVFRDEGCFGTKIASSYEKKLKRYR
ncbi:hypothetical protein N9A28_04940 [Sulfurimonas sp.]|nr:hypothetical protein [Sulfurimonas sp.]